MFGIGFSAGNHLDLYNKNARINDGVLTFIGKHPPQRVVLVSSSCVYSDNGPDLVDENSPLGEFPEIANIGYGFAKRHMEDRLKMAAMLNKFELSIARPLNIYGERYRWAGDFSQAIPMLVNKVMTQDKVVVWGSGRQRRTYVHASDCAEILYRLGLGSKHVPLINIGTEETISLNDLTEKIIKISGRSILIENDLSKPEGRFIKSCSRNELLKLFPDFEYQIVLDEGLNRMVEWWYKAVPK
jgi:nucleoside-diphosphate-sugar epimerase